MTVYPEKNYSLKTVETEEQEYAVQTCYQGHKTGEREQRKRVREI